MILVTAVVRSDRADMADAGVVDVQFTNLTAGLAIGAALLLDGVLVVRWSTRTGISSAIHEVAPASEVAGAPRDTERTGRWVPRRSLLAVAALLPVSAVLLLRDFGRKAPAKRANTIWAKGERLVTDVSYQPIQPSDLEVGELVNVVPESLQDLDEHAQQAAKAKAALVVVRIPASDIRAAEGREDWHIDGIIAYSKICTHVGCPMGLYERTTKHLLCPCHQSTFHLADNGAVLFGPATRALPQLPLAVDAEGYLVALSDFTEPVGPSYWERAA